MTEENEEVRQRQRQRRGTDEGGSDSGPRPVEPHPMHWYVCKPVGSRGQVRQGEEEGGVNHVREGRGQNTAPLREGRATARSSEAPRLVGKVWRIRSKGRFVPYARLGYFRPA